jgi:N-acetylneuraminic acid mutarotase
MVLGGYTGSSSLDTIVAGPPQRLRIVGRLPQPTHDAAAAVLGGSIYLFGGGESVSVRSVVRVDPRTGSPTAAPPLGEPLSDLGAVAIGGRAYLVGGYTGSQFATAILRYQPTTTIARLPTGTRYAGVAAIGHTVYVAGGLTTAGATRAVYAVSLAGSVRRVASLPRPEDHAALAALDGRLYLFGGRRVLAIDPTSGKVSLAARLPASLSDPTATRVGSRIVIAGGGTRGVWAARLARA